MTVIITVVDDHDIEDIMVKDGSSHYVVKTDIHSVSDVVKILDELWGKK